MPILTEEMTLRKRRTAGWVTILVLLATFLMGGSAGAVFDNIGPSPRTRAMGGAFAALADDGCAVFYNPAGLSQLMWPTAKDTARKMGIKGLRRSMLEDPATNLAIGATYLDWQLARFDGNDACGLSAYNAGPGAVERWLRLRSGYPTDEWVEETPYKQTRDYTRRVLQSYQTYHYVYVDQPAFIDLPLYVPTRSAE